MDYRNRNKLDDMDKLTKKMKLPEPPQEYWPTLSDTIMLKIRQLNEGKEKSMSWEFYWNMVFRFLKISYNLAGAVAMACIVLIILSTSSFISEYKTITKAQMMVQEDIILEQSRDYISEINNYKTTLLKELE